GRTAAERGGLATPWLLGFWDRRACDRRVRALRRHRSAGLRHRDPAQAGALPPHSACGEHRDDHRGRNAAAALSAARVDPRRPGRSAARGCRRGGGGRVAAGRGPDAAHRHRRRAGRRPSPVAAPRPAELTTLFGAFQIQPIGAFAVARGLALTTISLAVLLRRVLFGARNPEAPGVSDSSLSETWYLGLLAGGLLWVGLFPGGPKIPGTEVPLFDPGLINQMT